MGSPVFRLVRSHLRRQGRAASAESTRPRPSAVLRLMTSSNFVDRMTGRVGRVAHPRRDQRRSACGTCTCNAQPVTVAHRWQTRAKNKIAVVRSTAPGMAIWTLLLNKRAGVSTRASIRFSACLQKLHRCRHWWWRK